MLRLARAQFDMRCAEALTWSLEEHDDDIGPLAYGLFTGTAVSYARPFIVGAGNPYGALDAKWSTFPQQPELAEQHKALLRQRNQLLAHNDLTTHRSTLVWPEYDKGQPAILEARSPIQAEGARRVRELCRFQEARFGVHVQTLARRLQDSLGWRFGDEIDLDAELGRLRGSP